MTTTVRIDKSDDSEIWTVTIDRPEVRNAVDGPTARALADAFRAFDADATRARRRPHRRRRPLLRRRRPAHGRERRVGGRARRRRHGLALALDDDMGADGPMGPSRLELTQAGDRRRRGLRRRRRPRARRLVRPARRRDDGDVRRLLPPLRRAAHRRRHGAPAAPHRREPGDGPDPHRPRRRRRRGARARSRQPRRRRRRGASLRRSSSRARSPRFRSSACATTGSARAASTARRRCATRSRRSSRSAARRSPRARPKAGRAASSPAPASTAGSNRADVPHPRAVADSAPAPARPRRRAYKSVLRHVRKRRVTRAADRHNRRMTIDGDAAYQVLLAHDARFDGRLFVGVTSTGVYCRPICRVRMPARRNCRFFASPAQAEAASFRPCLKCRPEIAPGPGLAVDGDGRVAHARAPGGERARRVRRRRRGAERRRDRRTARRQRSPPAPHLLRRARRDAAAVPADAPAPARQAAPHRHADAGRADRVDERLSQPAPLQRRLPRRLSHEPDAAAPRDAARRGRSDGDGAHDAFRCRGRSQPTRSRSRSATARRTTSTP